MDRDNETLDIIELGAVSTETKGPVGIFEDDEAGRNQLGLTDA